MRAPDPTGKVFNAWEKGPYAGQPFWGCSGYPECKGTRAGKMSDASDRSDKSDNPAPGASR